jgi:hypothetical protein
MSSANNKNDGIRKAILEYLYRSHKNSRSLKSSRVPISQLKRDLKGFGLKERDIISNLDYLNQSGWVRVESEEKQIKTTHGFIKKDVKNYYKISDIGINYFEGPTEFQRPTKSFAGINVTNISGVTLIGDQNLAVNIQYLDLYKVLSLLSEAVRKSTQLSDTEKLNYVADVETIKDQLAKPEPDKNVIRSAWERLKELAKYADLFGFFNQVADLIRGVLT